MKRSFHIVSVLVVVLVAVLAGRASVNTNSSLESAPEPEILLDKSEGLYLAPASESCFGGLNVGQKVTFYPSYPHDYVQIALVSAENPTDVSNTRLVSYIHGEYQGMTTFEVYDGVHLLYGYFLGTVEYGDVFVFAATGTCQFVIP